jgi:DNA primase
MSIEVSSFKELSAVIKEKIDLKDYLEKDGIELKKTVQGGIGLCPFHKEKTPSFSVFSDTQTYHCFGCQKHGSIIDYVMEREGLDFKSTITTLAERNNIQLKLSPEDELKQKNIKEAYRLTSLLGRFFENKFLELPENHPAKKMITDRGLSINSVRYGYAPQNTNEVMNFLKEYIAKKEISPEIIRELGYLLKGNDNKPYFPISNRLMFYLQSQDDKIEGFTGRALTEEDTKKRKYVNSNNSIIYQKSREIYNFNQARKHIVKENAVYLVEGQFDVAAMIEAGYNNTVAISGTALDKQHINKISMLFRDKTEGKFILCLDDDKAGRNASKLVFKKNPSIHRNLYITVVPNGKDPCDYLGKNKENRLDTPIPYLDYVFELLKKVYLDTNQTDPYFIIDRFGSFLNKIPDTLLRSSYLQRLSSFTLVPIDIINGIIGNVDKKSIELLENYQNQNNVYSLPEGNFFDKALLIYAENRKSISNIRENDFPDNYKPILGQIKNMDKVILERLAEDNSITKYLIENFKNIKSKREFEDNEIEIHYNTLIDAGLKELNKIELEKKQLLFKRTLELATTPEEKLEAFKILSD